MSEVNKNVFVFNPKANVLSVPSNIEFDDYKDKVKIRIAENVASFITAVFQIDPSEFYIRMYTESELDNSKEMTNGKLAFGIDIIAKSDDAFVTIERAVHMLLRAAAVENRHANKVPDQKRFIIGFRKPRDIINALSKIAGIFGDSGTRHRIEGTCKVSPQELNRAYSYVRIWNAANKILDKNSILKHSLHEIRQDLGLETPVFLKHPAANQGISTGHIPIYDQYVH